MGVRILIDDLQTKEYLVKTNDFDLIWPSFAKRYGGRLWFLPIDQKILEAPIGRSSYDDLLAAHQQQLTRGQIGALIQAQKESDEAYFSTLQNLYHHAKSMAQYELKSLKGLYLESQERASYCIPTPFRELNKGLKGGLYTARLHILGARTGIGKSSMAIEISAKALQDGKKVLYVCLEMGPGEVLERFMKALGLSPKKDLYQNLAQLDQYPNLALMTTGSASLMDIESACAQQETDLLVVDYLGLMSFARESDTPLYRQIGYLSKGLQKLAKSRNIAVLALSQLKRSAMITKSSQDVEPECADLKESGELEQDADTVILIHRPNVMESAATVLVKKNRHGPCFRFMLSFKQGRFFNSTIIEKR